MSIYNPWGYDRPWYPFYIQTPAWLMPIIILISPLFCRFDNYDLWVVVLPSWIYSSRFLPTRSFLRSHSISLFLQLWGCQCGRHLRWVENQYVGRRLEIIQISLCSLCFLLVLRRHQKCCFWRSDCLLSWTFWVYISIDSCHEHLFYYFLVE